MGERPAFLVEPDGRTLALTLYGVQANPEISPILGNDTLVRRISWDQVRRDRVRFTFTLSQPVYGWLSLWDEARRAFVLRMRRAPVVDAGASAGADSRLRWIPGIRRPVPRGPRGCTKVTRCCPVGKLLVELLRATRREPGAHARDAGAVGLTERGGGVATGQRARVRVRST